MGEVNFRDLEGKTIKSYVLDDRRLCFFTDKYRYDLVHNQQSCEDVRIEDICGDLDDLVGSPVAQAREVSSDDPDPDPGDNQPMSYTWTFYKIATIKGRVTIRFYGESNGNYSESVIVYRRLL